MNKILIAAVALATFGSVAAQAAGRDATLYPRASAPQAQTQQVQPQAQRNIVEGRNATVTLPTVSDAYINQSVEANARSTH
jgi:type 1 fimbria pilin